MLIISTTLIKKLSFRYTDYAVPRMFFVLVGLALLGITSRVSAQLVPSQQVPGVSLLGQFGPGTSLAPEGKWAWTRDFGTYRIWAAAWDFQQCGILTSVDSDEHVQPPFKLRNSKWCSVSSLTIIEYSSD